MANENLIRKPLCVPAKVICMKDDQLVVVLKKSVNDLFHEQTILFSMFVKSCVIKKHTAQSYLPQECLWADRQRKYAFLFGQHTDNSSAANVRHSGVVSRNM